MSANLLAKITNGICDNLITNVVRAWDTQGTFDVDGQRRKKRILVAPAMNTYMWTHPLTTRQIRILEEDWGVKEGEDTSDELRWFEVLRPQEKRLACDDVGVGGMKEWEEIVHIIKTRLALA